MEKTCLGLCRISIFGVLGYFNIWKSYGIKGDFPRGTINYCLRNESADVNKICFNGFLTIMVSKKMSEKKSV